ncbi:MAG: hypothetical protein WBP37_13650, partial [Candidatus Dechloromonas phosphoritropha]
EAFYQVAIFVKVLIETTLDNTIAFGRDDRLNLIRSKMLDDRVYVAGFVRTQQVGQQIAQQEQRLRAAIGPPHPHQFLVSHANGIS